MFEKEKELHKKLLSLWSLNMIKKMELYDYVNVDNEDYKKTFTYWIDHATTELGNIRGAWAKKFGIYQQYNVKDISEKSLTKDKDNYVWYKSLGDKAEDAFEHIKYNVLIPLIKNAQKGNFDAINDVDGLWPLFKTKIAFIYQNFSKDIKILPIYSPEKLREFLKEESSLSITDLHKIAIKKYNIKTFDDAMLFMHKIFLTRFADTPNYKSNAVPKKRVLPPREYKGIDCSTIHSDIQKGLANYLKNNGYKVYIEAYHGIGNNSRIDIVSQKGVETIYYEIKPYSAKECIQEALGQLLEYWYYNKSDKYPKADKLVIVGPADSCVEDNLYLEKLNKKHKIPIEYHKFDVDSNTYV